MGLLLYQRAPGPLQPRGRGRMRCGLRPQRLDLAQQPVFGLLVGLLQRPPGGQHIRQHEGLGVAAQLPVQRLAGAAARQHLLGMGLQRGPAQPELALRLVEGVQALREVLGRGEVVSAVGQQQRAAHLRVSPRGQLP